MIKFHGKHRNTALLRKILLVYSFKFKRPADHRDVIAREWALVFDPLARAVTTIRCRSSSNSNHGYCILVLKTRLRNYKIINTYMNKFTEF